METIVVRNVNEAYLQGRKLLRDNGQLNAQRRGEMVRELPYPVTTIYQNPRERVLFCPGRRANPFFHLMEAIWMLAGRDDVEWISKYNKRMKEYSDDGLKFNAPYGYRWAPQLHRVVWQLKSDPYTRHASIVIGVPRDFTTMTKDVPCNLVVSFNYTRGRLNMTVFCRSNDAIWGAYGANAVHFSILHEVVAHFSGLPMGWYAQISNNFHEYVDVADNHIIRTFNDPYKGHSIIPDKIPDGIDLKDFLRECQAFCEGSLTFDNEFLFTVAAPMRAAWDYHRGDEPHKALDSLESMPMSSDWGLAAARWMTEWRKK